MHEVTSVNDETKESDVTKNLSERLTSIGIFVGTGECNAHCAHCAGVPHRRYAPNVDGVVDMESVTKTLIDCHARGASRLSLTGSGEPTLSPLSVTKVLEVVRSLREKYIHYSPINLYSNGIRIGQDKSFCEDYLPRWKLLGLTNVYVTVHDIDEERNAAIYGTAHYPPLQNVISRIHDAGLCMRANIVLSKRNIGTAVDFVRMVRGLHQLGVDGIAAWPVRGEDDGVDKALAPRDDEFNRIMYWATNSNEAHHVIVLGEHTRRLYETKQKLTLFPDGTLSGEWCNSK